MNARDPVRNRRSGPTLGHEKALCNRQRTSLRSDGDSLVEPSLLAEDDSNSTDMQRGVNCETLTLGRFSGRSRPQRPCMRWLCASACRWCLTSSPRSRAGQPQPGAQRSRSLRYGATGGALRERLRSRRTWPKIMLPYRNCRRWQPPGCRRPGYPAADIPSAVATKCMALIQFGSGSCREA